MQSGCTPDYGSGFYTTTSEKQSQAWVLRRMLEKCLSCGYANVYDFDDNKLLELNCLLFAETNKEWAAFFWQTGPKQVIRTITMSCMVLWLTTKFICSSNFTRNCQPEAPNTGIWGPVDLYAELKTEL